MSLKIRTNSDEQFARVMKEAVKKNDGYCPCSLDKTADTKCMCKEFRSQVADRIEGFCHCQLYEAYKMS